MIFLNLRNNHYLFYFILSISLIIFIYPFFSLENLYPIHDNLLKYQFFHSFYSELLQYNDLLLWMPFSLFGQSSYPHSSYTLQLSSYFVIFFGYIFNITNTYVLFKVAFVIDIFIYIFGLILISNEILKAKTAKLFLLLWCLFSIFSFSTPSFNFYIYNFFPLIIFGLIKYIKSLNINYLIFSGIIFLANFIGNVLYFIPYQFLIILSSLLLLIYFKSIDIKKTSFNKNSIYLIFVFISIIFLIIWSVYSSIEYSETIVNDRKSDLTITLENFLQHGRISPGTILFGFLTGELKTIFIPYGTIHGIDPTFYVGILTLFLFIYGIFKVHKDIYFTTFSSIFFIILAISIGGYFAVTIYNVYFPIRIFRHIGLVFEFGGKFLIIASAIVLDKLILNNYKQDIKIKN